jgi:Tannase and feruloyl esterase
VRRHQAAAQRANQNTTDMLTALEGWVENGQAPNAIIAYNNATHSLATISRPVCKYPDTLSYNGSGSIFDPANFTCMAQTADPLASSWLVGTMPVWVAPPSP